MIVTQRFRIVFFDMLHRIIYFLKAISPFQASAPFLARQIDQKPEYMHLWSIFHCESIYTQRTNVDDSFGQAKVMRSSL